MKKKKKKKLLYFYILTVDKITKFINHINKKIALTYRYNKVAIQNLMDDETLYTNGPRSKLENKATFLNILLIMDFSFLPLVDSSANSKECKFLIKWYKEIWN